MMHVALMTKMKHTTNQIVCPLLQSLKNSQRLFGFGFLAAGLGMPGSRSVNVVGGSGRGRGWAGAWEL